MFDVVSWKYCSCEGSLPKKLKDLGRSREAVGPAQLQAVSTRTKIRRRFPGATGIAECRLLDPRWKSHGILHRVPCIESILRTSTVVSKVFWAGDFEHAVTKAVQDISGLVVLQPPTLRGLCTQGIRLQSVHDVI